MLAVLAAAYSGLPRNARYRSERSESVGVGEETISKTHPRRLIGRNRLRTLPELPASEVVLSDGGRHVRRRPPPSDDGRPGITAAAGVNVNSLLGLVPGEDNVRRKTSKADRTGL
jgi:hypothetical protein